MVASPRDLLRHLRGKVVVVWGGGPNRAGPVVRDVPEPNGRLTRERRPAYAPDRNPVEAARSWLRYGRLAGDVPGGIPERDDEIGERPAALAGDPGPRKVVSERSGLPLPQKPGG